MKRLTVLAAMACLPLIAQAHELSAEATYLGNEGVLVARGDTKVLFDAFYTNSYGQYTLVPDEIADAILAGDPPYDGITAIFVSHVHGDHFSAEPAVTYLRAHPEVQLYATKQVREAILEFGIVEDDELLSRLHTYALEPTDDPIEVNLDDLLIEAVAIPHSGGERMADINNFAWRVTLDGLTTAIHLGDSGTVEADFERHRPFFSKRTHHAAFVPYWMYLNAEGLSIIGKHINAEQTIGVHVPSRTIGNGDQTREQLGGDAFTDPGETRQIGQDK